MSDIEHGYRVVWGDITYDCQTWEEVFERFGELEREDEHCFGQIVPISNGVPGTAVLWPRLGTGLRPW